MSTLPERLRALHETRRHHFTPIGHGGKLCEPAFAIVATEARWADLLEAADALEEAPDEALTRDQVREAVRAEMASLESAGWPEHQGVLARASILTLCARLGVEL